MRAPSECMEHCHGGNRVGVGLGVIVGVNVGRNVAVGRAVGLGATVGVCPGRGVPRVRGVDVGLTVGVVLVGKPSGVAVRAMPVARIGAWKVGPC